MNVQEVIKTQIDRPGNEGTRHDHPAFGRVGASRVSSTGSVLHGSDFRHTHFISLKIHNADFTREISHDYHHATQEIVEVLMTEAQWATMISSLNMGNGVPCTLRYVRDVGAVPMLPEPRGETAEYAKEVRETVQDAISRLTGILEENSNLKKSVRHAIEMARQELEKNVPYVVSCFDEHAEETVEKAKIEIETYLTSAVARAGLEALGGTVSPLALPPVPVSESTD